MPNVRPFSPTDIPAIKTLLAQLQAVEAALQPNRKSDPAVAAEEIWSEGEKMINEGKGVVFVALMDDVIIGVGIGFEDNLDDPSLAMEARKVGYISDLIVDQEWRGKGVGTDLLQSLLGWFRDHGLKIARIGAITENKGAIKLYEQMGFAQVSVALERPL